MRTGGIFPFGFFLGGIRDNGDRTWKLALMSEVAASLS